MISAMLEDGEGRERKEEVVVAGGTERERERLEANNLLTSMGITHIPSG